MLSCNLSFATCKIYQAIVNVKAFESSITFLKLLIKTISTTNYFSSLERVFSTEVTISHLIAYDQERDLLPLILAHCNYSLEVGKETIIQYDWAALERQLIDRFLRGRPYVEFKVN